MRNDFFCFLREIFIKETEKHFVLKLKGVISLFCNPRDTGGILNPFPNWRDMKSSSVFLVESVMASYMGVALFKGKMRQKGVERMLNIFCDKPVFGANFMAVRVAGAFYGLFAFSCVAEGMPNLCVCCLGKMLETKIDGTNCARRAQRPHVPRSKPLRVSEKNKT